MMRTTTQAFTLVELSIVLVILGLLTGGILTGQSLIRAAELRSVVTEYQRYQTAIQTFRDRYQAIPGDMKTATKFWGDDAAACADAAVTDGTPGTCNGNGDGNMNGSSGANATGEDYQLWKQLALAGLIEGSYTGISGAAAYDVIAGTNVPVGRMGNTGWSAQIVGFVGDGSFWQLGANYNFLQFGTKSAGSLMIGAALRPEEAWKIEQPPFCKFLRGERP